MQENPIHAEKELKRRSNPALRLLLAPEVGTLIPIIIVAIVTGAIKKGGLGNFYKFWTWKYFSSILKESVYIGTCALGEALIIMNGEIDLSLGMSGCFGGIMMGVAAYMWNWPLLPCVLLCVVSSCLIGFINGMLVTRLNLPSWITTLATQFVCTGLAVTIGQGIPLNISSLGVKEFTRAKPLGLTWLFFIFIAIIVIVDFVVRKTQFGYKLRAVGGNTEAALMAGINTKNVKLMVFVAAAFLASIGGLFDVLANGAAADTYGVGREFRCIICCNVGGIAAGSGSIYGVALGILLFHVLRACLQSIGFNTNVQLMIIGIVLLLAVVLDVFRKRMEKKDISRL